MSAKIPMQSLIDFIHIYFQLEHLILSTKETDVLNSLPWNV